MKKCPNCKDLKLFDEFSKCKGRKDGLQVYCKICMKIKNAEHYQNGYKLKQSAHNVKNRKLMRDRINQYKSGFSCVVCGESEICCLDFHHKDENKEYSVSSMVNRFGDWNLILKEIKKCVLLCANCHRKVHAKKLKI